MLKSMRKGNVSMDLGFLTNYVNVLTLGICLCVGYALKTAFNKFPNKYIPLVGLILGCVINVLLYLDSGINAEVILSGMISGLSSTGLYEMFRNLLAKDSEKKAS